ncbi:MAG TPA: hypothetical protein DCM54_12230 [Gammaproteobacteria bacterium]|nr:hypothetical protein [Gammaproteobacteria bacterium]
MVSVIGNQCWNRATDLNKCVAASGSTYVVSMRHSMMSQPIPITVIKSTVAKTELLDDYRRKRNSDGTPEPFGGRIATKGAMRFVVHHHAARNTHYDLRLEMEGVLRSWAVPKGPSPNVKDKRFATLVEDHPLEYGDFEAKIPDGNYGAGWSIVWDRGFYRPIVDPLEGLANGKILFELQGQKLHGKWTLVRLKGKEKDWLFIK